MSGLNRPLRQRLDLQLEKTESEMMHSFMAVKAGLDIISNKTSITAMRAVAGTSVCCAFTDKRKKNPVFVERPSDSDRKNLQ